ncbi:hypothetical protein AAGS40_28880 (plasmid) [Paraburkholderia sp. PREW-6R]|uniref:hypothetical protein n=1 Tax=Paraburkholderia sp. PREW-6R TaxID=3141544 RepID=UPI0031F517D5
MNPASDAVPVIQVKPTPRRGLCYRHGHSNAGLELSGSGRRSPGFRLLRALLIAVPSLFSGLSPVPAQADTPAAADEICMPEGTYPMAGGGTTVFPHRVCFSRPVTRAYSWEKKIARAKQSAPDPFNGARVVRYDYHDARYHCANRGMRLPTVEELKALFAYANTAKSTAKGSQYAIIAPKGDSRYAEGLYGWGGGSVYWSHSFAGRGLHKVVNLGDGKVGVKHDSYRSYVSCVR